jgi:hypothetical protein
LITSASQRRITTVLVISKALTPVLNANLATFSLLTEFVKLCLASIAQHSLLTIGNALNAMMVTILTQTVFVGMILKHLVAAFIPQSTKNARIQFQNAHIQLITPQTLSAMSKISKT